MCLYVLICLGMRRSVGALWEWGGVQGQSQHQWEDSVREADGGGRKTVARTDSMMELKNCTVIAWGRVVELP